MLSIFFLLFLFCNLYAQQVGGENPFSRTAATASIVERGSYEISPYIESTRDWSRTPDGRYFSNKAPGPMLLGLPFYWMWDLWKTRGVKSEEKRNLIRIEHRHEASFFVSIFLQLIPSLFVAFFAVGFLREQGVSRNAQLVFLFAAFFANTFALKLNTNFGHGITGLLCLSSLLFWLKARYTLLGLTLGLTLLCDYSGLFVLLAVFAGMFLRRELKPKTLLNIALGATLPAALWIHYHVSCFGSPFKISTHFQNPHFQDMRDQSDAFMGVISLLPRWDHVWNLIRGSSRGLLQTQAWILLWVLVSLWFLIKKRSNRESAFWTVAFSLLVFGCLFYMNASFGGWHGGATPGPRYLSYVFPSIALSLSLCWKDLGRALQSMFILGLFLSIIFYGMAMSTMITPPLEPILERYYSWIFLENFPPGAKTRFLVILTALVIGSAGCIIQRQKLDRSSF